MKLTVIFSIKLSKTTPAPPILHAFNIEGNSATALKSDYYKGVKNMKSEYPSHKDFRRLAIVEDKSELLMVTGISSELDESVSPEIE